MGQGKVVRKDPDMILFENFLSQEEVDYLLQIAEGRWQRSTTTRNKESELLGSKSNGASGNGEEVHGEVRTSSSVFLEFDESLVVERIAARVATVAGFPLSHVETLVLLRYRPGELFKLHHDGSMRAKTVFLYLNDVPAESGGATRFPKLGLEVRPVARTALMWSNRLDDGSADRRMDHEALPVVGEETVKYGMNCFVNISP